jgi:polyferredoxin
MSTFAQPHFAAPCPATIKVPKSFGWLASLVITLPMLLLTGVLLFGGLEAFRNPDLLRLGSLLTVWLGLNMVFFAMMQTGKTNVFRSTLFVIIAISFVLTFIPNLIETRGNIGLTQTDFIDGKTPFCHMVIPMVLIPAAFTKTIIFPGSLLTGYASIGSMLVLWLAASLTLGRGWCSWVCFFGGMDEGCSHLLKMPVMKTIDPRWTYLPLAILLVIVLASAATLSPTYCEWLCPFKAVTEFESVTNVRTLVQTVLFVSLFVGLVVVLPILTRKRTQCALFCPMGAFQSWTNKLNIHEIRVNREYCSDCGRCVSKCPTLSITKESVARGCALSSCTKCGLCVDECPRKAASFHVKWTCAFISPRLARVLFLYPAFLFMSAIGGSMMVGALVRILRLIATGSMF